ncbi:hypothetical protein SAURM35S_08319 [Streptomyces aurantiogriseus]
MKASVVSHASGTGLRTSSSRRSAIRRSIPLWSVTGTPPGTRSRYRSTAVVSASRAACACSSTGRGCGRPARRSRQGNDGSATASQASEMAFVASTIRRRSSSLSVSARNVAPCPCGRVVTMAQIGHRRLGQLADPAPPAAPAPCSDGCSERPAQRPCPLLCARDFQCCPRDFRGLTWQAPKTGKASAQIRALAEAKPQQAADESGCTPGSVTRSPRGGRGDGHPSRTGVAAGLVRSTRGLGRAALERPRRNTRVFPFDLAPGGVYLAAQVTLGTGGLLHHRFTLTEDRGPRRSVFCGTVPRVTPGGR